MPTQPRPINDTLVLRLPSDPTDEQIIEGIRRWLQLLAVGDYPTAVEAFYFRWGHSPESLRDQIEGFFGEQHRSKVDSPAEEVLKRTEVYRTGIPSDCKAVVGFFVPLVNGLGIWTTALVRQYGESAILEFEIFHL